MKCNPPYLPPEARGEQPTSRPHDIWALGCLFLELLIWHEKGWAALQTFRVEREEENYEDWCVPGQDPPVTIVLVPTVLSELDLLEITAPWAGHAQLIRDMLHIDPGQRPTAAQVDQSIQTFRF